LTSSCSAPPICAWLQSHPQQPSHGARTEWSWSTPSSRAAIGRARADATSAKVVARICRNDLIVIDDIGSLSSRCGACRGSPPTRTAAARSCTRWRTATTRSRWLPAGQDVAEAFYRLVEAAYERRSVAVTSNIKPSGFDTIMPKTLATTTVDRLLHHAHQILTDGRSQRLAEAVAGKGVVPLV
jgi:hypothetical protein